MKNLLNRNNPSPPPSVIRRFPFGVQLEYNGKIYRYLYTYGENDVLMIDDDKPGIVIILSKYIISS
jgi:hypothetical protein